MTRDQRAALRLAVEAIHDAMKHLATDANIARQDKNASPMMKRRLVEYEELAQAAKTIETMLSQGSLL
jgi:hypothetical protein